MTEIGFLYRCGTTTSEEVRPANGKTFQLTELQGFVSGFIELVPGIQERTVYCNENGRSQRLPVNTLASKRFNQILLGDIIQVTTLKPAEIPRVTGSDGKSYSIDDPNIPG